jgi:hypothetical protein
MERIENEDLTTLRGGAESFEIDVGMRSLESTAENYRKL